MIRSEAASVGGQFHARKTRRRGRSEAIRRLVELGLKAKSK
jgi:hypothetical protein